ncbi:coiled-coil-helix-coiled-coil-helix domain-containing protein 7 isoform X3 [Ptiloglossa arizonensis]|uniref:coiled-coil-helix-coiled-coil-helix domain-containing protein 7 isoform X3 n=1 Tax=Ptiloglossa arizonensis TaxID=3350558 RepID=UPI003FA0DB84
MNTSKSSEVAQIKNIQSVNDLQHNQAISNPCLKEHNLSLMCLDKNDYKPENCEVYFQNYNNCKKFWEIYSD